MYKVKLNNLEVLNQQLVKIRRQLWTKIEKIDQNPLTTRQIHHLRTNIRSARSSHCLLKDLKCWKQYKPLDKTLKSIFKDCESSRKLSVFVSSLYASGLETSRCESIDKEIQKENNAFTKLILDHRSQIKKALNDSYPAIVNRQALKNALDNIIAIYDDALSNADLDSMNSIHALRIKGKKVKYLLENNYAITSDDNFLIIINDIHHCIGELHDVDENLILLERYKGNEYLNLTNEEFKMIQQYYLSTAVDKKNKLEKLLLEINKES